MRKYPHPHLKAKAVGIWCLYRTVVAGTRPGNTASPCLLAEPAAVGEPLPPVEASRQMVNKLRGFCFPRDGLPLDAKCATALPLCWRWAMPSAKAFTPVWQPWQVGGQRTANGQDSAHNMIHISLQICVQRSYAVALFARGGVFRVNKRTYNQAIPKTNTPATYFFLVKNGRKFLN